MLKRRYIKEEQPGMEEPTRKITTRKADGDTVAALKRLLRESGVSVPEEGGAQDTTSADIGAGAGKNTTAGNNKKDGEGDTVASLKRLLREAGATTGEGGASNAGGSSDGADAGAGAAADKGPTSTKQSADSRSATEGSGTIADLKRLIQEAEDEKKKRDILISNQKKEIEDMKAKLEQMRLAKQDMAVPEKKTKKKKKKKKKKKQANIE